MKVALYDHERGNGYPNAPLMKLSAWHKKRGDNVEWFSPIGHYDKVYASKVFTWTETNPYLPDDTVFGGTGFFGGSKVAAEMSLPDEVEFIVPDYSLYDCKESYGFLTRGCIRKCKWCFVPEKEGKIRKHQHIEDFLCHDKVVLMDNNVLAHEHGLREIEKMADLGVKVDFNQGLDARLITSDVARLLKRVKWDPCVRLACDSMSMIEHVRRAVENLRWHNVTPTRYFCYVLVTDDIEDAIARVKCLKGMHVDPFCQPYRDKNGSLPSDKQKQFARWCNHKAIYKKIPWEDYSASKKR